MILNVCIKLENKKLRYRCLPDLVSIHYTTRYNYTCTNNKRLHWPLDSILFESCEIYCISYTH